MPRFGSWSPDLPALNNPGATVANGVYSTNSGFKPFLGPTVISNALTGQCRGAITFKRTNGTLETFAGDPTKLYRLSGTTFNNVSKVGDYTATIRWRFTIFGDIVIATNDIDTVQQFDLSSDSIFSDNAGAPIHSFPFVVRNFLVAADVNDGTQFQLKWSADNDSSKFTADCGGGAQEFPEGGPVVGGTGGEVGIVFQEDALSRMVFVGGDLRFTFDTLEGASGAITGGSIIRHKGLSYYLAESGFQLFNGAESRNISTAQGSRESKAQAVTDTFFDNLDRSKIATMQGALDLANDSVVWAYPSSSASAGENDKLIIFNITNGDWSEVDIITQTLFQDETATGKVLAGFDTSNRLVRYTGTTVAAQIVTREFGQQRKFRVRSLRIDTDGPHTCTISHRRDQQDSVTSTSAVAVNANGRCPIKANNRYQRFQLDIAAAASWTFADGFDSDGGPGGRIN